MDSHDFDSETKRNKANVKGSRSKNLDHCHQTRANFSIAATKETGYKITVFTAQHFSESSIRSSECKLGNSNCYRNFKASIAKKASALKA